MAQFSLVTFNCFGVPMLTTRQRLLTLATELNRRKYTVVCLQEVQATIYRKLLVDTCRDYSTSAYEPFVYAPKGGLLTLARLPVEERAFSLYRARELVSPLAAMDLMLHKGVLLARMTIDEVPIIILNTHLNANYRGDWSENNRYARAEHRQLQQLAEIVRAQPAEALVVAAGDYNIPRGSWLYNDFLEQSGMIDPLADDARPTYRMPPGLPSRLARPIDFTLVRVPPLPGLTITSDICFDQPLSLGANRSGYLSDHNGVELHISWDE